MVDAAPHKAAASGPRKSPRHRVWPFVLGGFVFVIIVLAAVWDWDWFRPLVEIRASAVLGRPVTMDHFDIRLGRQPVAVADGVRIANPDGFPQDPPLAAIRRLAVTIDAMALLGDRAIVLPDIAIEQPHIVAAEDEDGQANYLFPSLSTGGTSMKIGALRISGGDAHVVLRKRRADFDVTLDTRGSGDSAQLIAQAKGSYAGQPVKGEFVGGGLLQLRNTTAPYPMDLKLQNGPTRIGLNGTVQDPLRFSGVDLKLELDGTDMELLLPLIGIALPKTPSYRIKGDLDYADHKIRFRNFAGQLGSSDLEGDIEVDPGPERPVVTADVHSRLVDLADLGGFIGSEPGRMSTPNQTPEQRRALARAEASPQLLPTTTISLPKVRVADVHLKYRGAKIEGRNMPFDTFATDMDIVDGRISLHPISLGVGQGRIAGTVELTPLRGDEFRTKANIEVQRLELGHMLKAANMLGSGVFGGRAVLDTTGNSTATMLGNGNGSLQLTMAGGGSLSALLVDLSGLQFGNALFSALGIPEKDTIECFVADFRLEHGVMQTRALLLDTTSDIVSGSGTINLADETVDYQIKTDAKHFSIGSLPAPISIKGSFKSPGAMPEIGRMAARGAAAVGLGIVFPPAAILPTIQFGVGDDHRCQALAHRSR